QHYPTRLRVWVRRAVSLGRERWHAVLSNAPAAVALVSDAVSEAPFSREPDGIGVIDLRNVDTLVGETRVQVPEEREAQAGAIDEVLVVAGHGTDFLASRFDLQVVEEVAHLREELERTERQRPDQHRREARDLGRDRHSVQVV